MVYLNGRYVPKEEARVSVEDRGFLLADGVYEVTPAYAGATFRLDVHLRRLAAGLAALRIPLNVPPLEEVHRRLLEENGLAEATRAKIYVQVTRGAAPRTHGFPVPAVSPTVYASAEAWSAPPAEAWERGFAAITVPDRRWSRVDIKSIALLPNVLAQQAAVDAGVEDAILVRDGIALEGSHANLFAVLDGTLVTHPRTNRILPGVTRAVVLELAAEHGIPAEERAIQAEELAGAEEVFLTGTTTEVRPLVRVDGRAVGSGSPGPITRLLAAAYLRLVGASEPVAP